MAKRVLAVASGGGHWEQLFRLRPAWDGHEIHYLTTLSGYREILAEDARRRRQPVPALHVVRDANMRATWQLLRQLAETAAVVRRVRPDIVITTGASVGYAALRVGGVFGARGVWIDSIANADRLSLSGRRAGAVADLWLTQWRHLAGDARSGPRHEGAVL